MGYKALLTLDLGNGVSSEMRKLFYEYLEKEKWKKLPDLTTAWTCSFTDDVSRESAVNVVRNDVAGAAEHARLEVYNAAVQFGKGSVEVF